MELLKVKCYEDSFFGVKYNEETYPRPIYEEDIRWEGTLIANEYGGFEGHVDGYEEGLFVFGYYIPNKGLMLLEFKKNDSSFNVINLDPDLDCPINDKNAEILNPDYSILRMFSSYHEGGYEVVNHLYNQYCGSTESYCRIVIEDVKQIEKDDLRNNEEIKSIVNKILEQREKMTNKHKNIYLRFSTSLHESITNKPESKYIKKLKDDR